MNPQYPYYQYIGTPVYRLSNGASLFIIGFIIFGILLFMWSKRCGDVLCNSNEQCVSYGSNPQKCMRECLYQNQCMYNEVCSSGLCLPGPTTKLM